jgi:hypothetical protein
MVEGPTWLFSLAFGCTSSWRDRHLTRAPVVAAALGDRSQNLLEHLPWDGGLGHLIE